jgi:hypothetical protein
MVCWAELGSCSRQGRGVYDWLLRKEVRFRFATFPVKLTEVDDRHGFLGDREGGNDHVCSGDTAQKKRRGRA